MHLIRRRGLRPAYLVLSALVLGATLTALTSPASAQADPGDGTTITIPGHTGARALATGPDGAIWAVGGLSAGDSWVVRLSLDGTILSDMPLASGAIPISIAEGADGRMWIAYGNISTVIAIAADGTVSSYATPNPANEVIMAGPDDRMWVLGINQVAVMTLDGGVEATIPTGSQPSDLVVGSDGYIWVNSFGDSTLLRIDPVTRAVSTFATVGRPGNGLAVGPDGDIWYPKLIASTIGHMPAAGGAETTIPAPAANPNYLLFDSTGTLWASYQGSLDHVTATTGATTIDYPVGDTSFTARMLETSDGRIWVVMLDAAAASIRIIDPVRAPTLRADAPAATLGTSYDVTIGRGGQATFSIDEGALPAGLSLDPATGRITGAPTALASSSFRVTVTNPLGTATRTFTLTVLPPTELAETGPTDALAPLAFAVAALLAGTVLVRVRRRHP
ncbi:virginiamycin B lyase family protein [Protaetiibacter larvae]|uniref:Uncharacterized protein n=1 Tax=Protaetiibacter larvae TaxID=2592654 RepID=A0A5C1Y9Q9_9MICO|nr:putative Ig domain-containing protein [Protaetiibacter larvae]QEO10546.1 hypothetical protein FLP23_11375 [Protaetiibacter larvae]